MITVYHVTTKANWLLHIQTEGLKTDQEPNFTFSASTYIKDLYGIIPIFVSLTNPLQKKGYYTNKHKEVILSFQIEKKDLFGDLPTLVDHGLYLNTENDEGWFKKTPKLLQSFVDDNEIFSLNELIFDPLLRLNVVKLTKTAAILKNIEPNKITRTI